MDAAASWAPSCQGCLMRRGKMLSRKGSEDNVWASDADRQMRTLPLSKMHLDSLATLQSSDRRTRRTKAGVHS